MFTRKDEHLKGVLGPGPLVTSAKYKADFYKRHPDYFRPEGLLVFCGPQGSGKTLSAVQYVRKIIAQYPKCKFVTNVQIEGLPEDLETYEYNGLDSLSNITNGYNGVLYLIDEIHLEFNSLESKSISIEEMTEFAQQRKQRKHIVGTSQVFMRMAKPLREQIRRVVLCRNYFGLVQHNIEIDGTTAVEEDGHLKAEIRGHYYWCHTPDLYGCYDTYAKMNRLKKEWKGRTRGTQATYLQSYGGAAAGAPGPGLRGRK